MRRQRRKAFSFGCEASGAQQATAVGALTETRHSGKMPQNQGNEAGTHEGAEGRGAFWLIDGSMSHGPFGTLTADPDHKMEASDLPGGAAESPDHLDDPWVDRRARVRAQLERASAWQRDLDHGTFANRAEIAQVEKLSRARVSQVMKLLELSEEIRRGILDPERVGPLPTEKELRKLAEVQPHDLQNLRYRRMIEALAPPRVTEWKGRPKPESLPPRRGFRHLFDQARRYQALLDSGDHPTVASVGRSVGLTGTRVSQLLNLLHLAPDLIALLDVEADQVPEGMGTKDLRALARLRTWEEQRVGFEGMRGIRPFPDGEDPK